MAEDVRRRRVGWGEVVAAGATLVRAEGVDGLTFEGIANQLDTDAADVTYWFGTRLEQRFTRAQIETILQAAGFEDIRFSPNMPFWCAVGIRRR